MFFFILTAAYWIIRLLTGAVVMARGRKRPASEYETLSTWQRFFSPAHAFGESNYRDAMTNDATKALPRDCYLSRSQGLFNMCVLGAAGIIALVSPIIKNSLVGTGREMTESNASAVGIGLAVDAGLGLIEMLFSAVVVLLRIGVLIVIGVFMIARPFMRANAIELAHCKERGRA